MLLFLIPFFLCWGSFLNVLAYRLVRLESIVWPASRCPHCNHSLAWYDLIPVFSWLLLKGRCRYCRYKISPLYPLIELLTVALLSALYLVVPAQYFFAYFVLFSALIVTIRSDIETMLISRLMTLALIPFGIAFAAVGWLPIAPIESVLGALLGYFILYVIAKIFYALRGQQGIGDGDFDLLAFIGSFLGPLGCWIALFIGSIVGSIIGSIYIKSQKKWSMIKIPFGPFLALGAIIYVFFQEYLVKLVLPT